MAWADESGVGDIIEQGAGSRRFGLARWLGFRGRCGGPGWRPSRGAAVLAAVTLLAGLAAGYAAGKQTSGGSAAPAPRPIAAPAPSVSISASLGAGVADPLADVDAVRQVKESCATQNGSELQLGVEVTNQSAAAVTLTGLKIVFPGDGGALREISWQWAPCGAINYGLYQPTVLVAPGSSAWLSATFKVLVHCPAAYPVQFSVSYVADGVHATTTLPGFPDLGQVPYMGCPTQPAVFSGGASASVILSAAPSPAG